MQSKKLQKLKLYTIKINAFSIIAIALFAYSAYVVIDGATIRQNLSNIQNAYDATSLKAGMYIETDLTRDDFMGNWGRNISGRPTFFPLVNENAATSAMSYIVAISENKDYYMTLTVSWQQNIQVREYYYHLIGKIINLERDLPYSSIVSVQESNEDIARLIGSDSIEEINQYVSPDYAIVIADIVKEKRRLHNGLGGILLTTLLFFAVSVKRRLNDDFSLFDIPPQS
jgi:hypothetical protein